MKLKGIFYSTIIAIFTEAIRYNIGFDLKIFYLIIFINFIIFLLLKRIRYNKGLLFFHTILLLSGTISNILGYNSIGYFSIQLFFLLIIPIYHYSFFKFYEDKLQSIIYLYCNLCVVLSIIGLLKYPYDLSQGERLHSLMLEPAHYCTVVLPAFFITLKSKIFHKYYSRIILLSIVLSGSSLGYLGLGVSILLASNKASLKKILIKTLYAICIIYTVYNIYPPFKIRFNDTLLGLTSEDLSKVNLSSYALLSNFFVATQSFLSNPVFGNGLGSHITSRELYLKNLKGIEVFEQMEMDNLNAKDAGSLFLRVLSELGLIGIAGIIYFILSQRPCNFNQPEQLNVIVSKSILLYFFAKLLREGHYFSPEMWFFITLYFFVKKPFNYMVKN